MSSQVDEYASLVRDFIQGYLGAEDFCAAYICKFKSEQSALPEADFLILDRLFGDVDAFTDDSELIASDPEYFVDSGALKAKATKALEELGRLDK